MKIKENKKLVKGIFFGIMTAISFSVMMFFVKLTTESTTENMVVFYRFLVSLIWVIIILSIKHLRGEKFSIKSKKPGLQLFRSICGFTALLLLYYALKYAPLAEINSLTMTYALFIPILSFIFLKTKASLKNWSAIIIGFIGTLFIIRPYFENFNPIILIALLAAIAAAASILTTHQLSKHDSPYTIMLYYFSYSTILGFFYATLNWKTPDLPTLLSLLMVGIIGTLYQEFLTRSLVYAPPKIISPLLYLSVALSGIFDWLFWNHIPNLYFWFGVILVCLGCTFSVRYAKNQ